MQFTAEERELYNQLEAKKIPIQNLLDDLDKEVKAAEIAVQMVRDKVSKVKPGLVPLSEMQASLASALSRDKYYPDLTKSALIKHVKALLK